MPTTLIVPPATADPEDLADFLELQALDPADDGASIREFIRDLGIGSLHDGLDTFAEDARIDQDEEDIYESVAEAAFAEIDDRRRACGEELYPYLTDRSVLRPVTEATRQAYLFMALLSQFGVFAGPEGSKPTKTFEDICALAARSYLGVGSCAMVFGFPRRVLPAGFQAALNELCRGLGEGRGYKASPEAADQKDAKLDIVAWKDFSDKRSGKLIAFGQCAAGGDWRDKITELPQPQKWCEAWMLESPLVEPIRFFFVPHRVNHKYWNNTNRFGGILFDRCRIAQHASDLPESLVQECHDWSEYVIANHLLKNAA